MQTLSLRLQCLAVALVAAAVLAGAHILQAAGWQPCELCLKQRIPYWWGVPLAALAWFVWPSRFKAANSLPPYLMTAAALAFAIGAGLAVQHIGVEQGWWTTKCLAGGTSITDLMNTMSKTPIVACDETRPFLFGITLAVYNLIISIALCAASAIIALRAFLRQKGAH